MADDDYVVAHSEFVLSGPKVAFDVFRFENGKIVEHCDNIQDKCHAPNKSGRTQLDGLTEVTDADKTQANKAVVKAYWDAVVLGGEANRVAEFRSMDDFRQHNCGGEDNKSGAQLSKPGFVFKVEKVHKIPGEGNFVLVMSQGLFDGGQKLVFMGDTIHAPDEQFEDPSITVAFDVDQEAAAATRQRAFADAAKEGYLVAFDHMYFPGIGRIKKESVGYRWLPIPYINDAARR